MATAPATLAAQSPRDGLGRFAAAYGALANLFVLSVGIVFCIQHLQLSSVLDMHSDKFAGEVGGGGGFADVARLLLGNFLMPFSEALAQAVFPAEAPRLEVLGSWLPAMLGGIACGLGVLGQVSLRCRWALFVLPYAFFSVLQMAWQTDLYKTLRQVAVTEDFGEMQALGKQGRLQNVHVAMYQAPYETFASMYDQGKCSASVPAAFDEQVAFECALGGYEGKVVHTLVSEFCRARQATDSEQVADFRRRAESCEREGRRARVLPNVPEARELVFCRCRAALYDWLRFASRWLMAVWAAQLMGVWCVLYSVVEPNLARMEPTQRREVVGFAVAGMAFLLVRVAVFEEHADGGPGASMS